MGLIDESACWYPIRIVARDGKKWKVNPPVEEVEDWILYVVVKIFGNGVKIVWNYKKNKKVQCVRGDGHNRN